MEGGRAWLGAVREAVRMWLAPFAGLTMGLAAFPALATALVVTAERAKDTDFAGQGCGSQSALSIALPSAARRVRVTPKSGTVLDDVDTGAAVARVRTEIVHAGGQLAVRLTATGSDDTCSNPDRYATSGWQAEPGRALVRYAIRRSVYFRSYIQGSYLSPHARPGRIFFGERTEIDKVRWSRWNGRVAKGRGSLIYNNCVPNCAEDAGHRYEVVIRLSQVRQCRAGYEYTRFAFRFPGAKPSGPGRSYAEHHSC